MSFLQLAEPFLAYDIPVFPLIAREKIPITKHGVSDATLNLDQVKVWDAEYPGCNIGIAAPMGGDICFLEFDIKGGVKPASIEMGADVPMTRAQRSGKGFAHYIFYATERSKKLGNRSVNLAQSCDCSKEENRPCLRHDCKVWTPHHHHEWFSFRASNKYLVGAGSIHPNGVTYTTVHDVAPIPIPDWLCDWIERNSVAPKRKAKGSLIVSDEFDWGDFCDHYRTLFTIRCEKDDVWQVVDGCMGVGGRRHKGSVWTAFYWDGSSLGWSDFAQNCPLGGKSIGQVIAFMNEEMIKSGGEPYRGAIWSAVDDCMSIDPKWYVENIDDVEDSESCDKQGRILTIEEVTRIINGDEPIETVVETNEAVTEQRAYDVGMDAEIDALVAEQKRDGDLVLQPEDYLPTPYKVNIVDPDQNIGLDFPGQCSMYGKLADVANNCPQSLPLGWLYPAILTYASTLDIEDRDHFVRSNMYCALLGDVGTGKTFCMKAAQASIFLPGEGTVIKDAPGSHSGLMNQLSTEEPLPRILFLNELKTVLNACAIQGSNLPPMLCTFWEDDEDGGSVKKGRQVVYAKLSIVGGLACKDGSEFAKMFGASTVHGLADRFMFGYHNGYVKARPLRGFKQVHFDNLKPVAIPDWVWDAKDEWIADDAQRRRLSEHALRIALVAAACNGDAEVTAPCLEAAFRFIEWQLRLREVYKPGLAETKESECYEAIYSALKERRDYQKLNSVHHKGAELISGVKESDRWMLLHFRDTVNNKSYYRKYSGLIDRVRKSMVDNGIIESFTEEEEDASGKIKKSKTPFVLLKTAIR